MADLRLPFTPRRSESWWIENPAFSGGVSLTGSEQTVSGPAGRWRARMALVIRTPEQLLDLRGLLASLDGTANTVLLGPRDLSGQPSGTYTLAAAVVPGDTQITLRRTGAGVLVRGPYLAIGERLHIISRLPATDPGGAADVPIEVRPWIREARPAGTAINFAGPRLRMKMMPASTGAIERTAVVRSEVPLEFVESF